MVYLSGLRYTRADIMLSHAVRCFLYRSRSKWHAYRRVPASFIPREWQGWVLDRGSLTKRLQQASNGAFCVSVTAQSVAIPKLGERRALGLGMGRAALIREVELLCFDEVWVRARSVIPINSLVGPERRLRYLGERPLGAFLFASRAMRRGPLEICRIFEDQTTFGASFARRSIFKLHERPLLVSEHFLAPILEHAKQPDS